MMIDKTKLGVEFFDETFGGVYRGRTVLCYGRRESGKTVAAARFLHQAFRDGDRGLVRDTDLTAPLARRCILRGLRSEEVRYVDRPALEDGAARDRRGRYLARAAGRRPRR